MKKIIDWIKNNKWISTLLTTNIGLLIAFLTELITILQK